MYTNETPNLKLPQYLATDIPSWLNDINYAFKQIDDNWSAGGGEVSKDYVDEQVQSLQEQITPLNSDVTLIKLQINAIDTATVSNTSRISSLETATTRNSDNIATLQINKNAQDKINSNVNDTLTQLQETIDTLNNQITSMQSTIESLEQNTMVIRNCTVTASGFDWFGYTTTFINNKLQFSFCGIPTLANAVLTISFDPSISLTKLQTTSFSGVGYNGSAAYTLAATATISNNQTIKLNLNNSARAGIIILNCNLTFTN